jgi:hypothetical protein
MAQEPRRDNTALIVVAIISFIGTILAALIGASGDSNVEKSRQKAELTQIALAATPTQALTQTPSSTPTQTYTITPTPIACPYQRATDDETITALIQAEAIAAQNQDMETINKIFAAGAVLNDQANGKYGLSVEERYKDTNVKDAKHFDILLAGRDASGQTVYYTSGSEGYSYETGSDKLQYYFNGSTILATPTISPIPTKTQFGSEHWTLKKNDNGCWSIIQMDFNAGHIPFP